MTVPCPYIPEKGDLGSIPGSPLLPIPPLPTYPKSTPSAIYSPTHVPEEDTLSPQSFRAFGTSPLNQQFPADVEIPNSPTVDALVPVGAHADASPKWQARALDSSPLRQLPNDQNATRVPDQTIFTFPPRIPECK